MKGQKVEEMHLLQLLLKEELSLCLSLCFSLYAPVQLAVPLFSSVLLLGLFSSPSLILLSPPLWPDLCVSCPRPSGLFPLLVSPSSVLYSPDSVSLLIRQFCCPLVILSLSLSLSLCPVPARSARACEATCLGSLVS